MKKRMILILLTVLGILIISGCGNQSTDTSGDEADTIISGKVDVKYTARDISGDYDEKDAQNITLDDEDIINITEDGVYILSGKLKDGQITVSADDTDKVQLVLKDAFISCSFGPAIYVENADKVFITLAEDTENIISDSSKYSSGADANGAVYSKDNLVINGKGSLTVNGNYEDGIVSKDDLKICGGNINVTAKDDGLRGNDSVRIYDGTISLNCDGDGIKSDNTEDDTKGFVSVDGGKISIDGVSSQGIDASNIAQVTGGSLSIKSSNEGIEGKIVYISGGKIQTDVTDDCLNATSTDKVVNSESAQDGVYIEIAGGKLDLTTSSGDGLDSNGDLTITGGTIYLNGASSGVEVPIDYNGESIVSGGSVFATGSSDSQMLQNFGHSSTQCSLLYSISGNKGDEIVLTNSDGNEVLSFTADKNFGSLLISNSKIELGNTYTLKVNNTENTVTFNETITSIGTNSGGSFGLAPGGHGSAHPGP